MKTTLLASLLASAFMVNAATPINKVVAVVDNDVILESDLDHAMDAARQQITARGQAVPPEHILRPEVLRQLILKQVQLERLKRASVALDEATLNAAVSEIAKQEGANSLAEFQQKLDARKPGSYAALRQQISQDLSLNRLRQQQVNARIKVSDQDIDNFLKSPQGTSALSNEVHVAHLRISLPEDSNASQIQAAEKLANQIRTALQRSSDIDHVVKDNQNSTYKVDGVDMGWRKLQDMPDELAAKVSGLGNNEVTSPIRAADGFHVLKLLERRGGAERTIVKQYKVRHILIRPSEIVSASDAEQQINQLYKRVVGGENFADLASTFSNDPGSAANGGDLDWVSPGMMVPQFDDMMVKTPVGQISKSFQTQYGWHILKVEDTRQQDVTEQYRRNMARQILAERQFEQELDNWLREIRAEAYVEIKDGTQID
ncbi:peptidylprolyl isomerase [Alkanindiges sp. WGS2144]|uniref:peptidylprolyl isomerase n=1 Tax=Alkanindiges sp. WGS2144 TaxID=3366808 RepID=UPI0037524642